MAQDHSYTGDIISLGLPDVFVEHGEIEELRAQYGLDAYSIGLLIRDYGKSARQ
jgi:deoxyxylulose-5-phosphate synthase